MSINKVILVGNLGQKPEIKVSNSGLAISRLRIATSDRRKDSDGSWNNVTEWHTVVVFGSTAENCEKYLDKGSQVYAEGRLQTNKWQDKEGNDRWTTEVIAQQVKFLSSKNSKPSNGASSPDYGSGVEDAGDSEIPF